MGGNPTPQRRRQFVHCRLDLGGSSIDMPFINTVSSFLPPTQNQPGLPRTSPPVRMMATLPPRHHGKSFQALEVPALTGLMWFVPMRRSQLGAFCAFTSRSLQRLGIRLRWC
jgi:hypothetical protein